MGKVEDSETTNPQKNAPAQLHWAPSRLFFCLKLSDETLCDWVGQPWSSNWWALWLISLFHPHDGSVYTNGQLHLRFDNSPRATGCKPKDHVYPTGLSHPAACASWSASLAWWHRGNVDFRNTIWPIKCSHWCEIGQIHTSPKHSWELETWCADKCVGRMRFPPWMSPRSFAWSEAARPGVRHWSTPPSKL